MLSALREAKFPYPPAHLCHICAILRLKIMENDGIGLKIEVNEKLTYFVDFNVNN